MPEPEVDPLEEAIRSMQRRVHGGEFFSEKLGGWDPPDLDALSDLVIDEAWYGSKRPSPEVYAAVSQMLSDAATRPREQWQAGGERGGMPALILQEARKGGGPPVDMRNPTTDELIEANWLRRPPTEDLARWKHGGTPFLGFAGQGAGALAEQAHKEAVQQAKKRYGYAMSGPEAGRFVSPAGKVMPLSAYDETHKKKKWEEEQEAKRRALLAKYPEPTPAPATRR